jgi:glycosyltransferase involved in cell wall biosynthesis
VLNEAAHLKQAIKAILDSDYSGILEIVIAVGPSKDGTEDVANQLAQVDSRIKVVRNPSGRTPDGLNAAISSSSYEIIVRVDGHSEIAKDYIRIAVATLEQTGAVNVGGVMAAEGRTRFERAVARAMRSAIGVGPARFHTGGVAGSVDTVYLGVFRKQALLEVGGYDSRFTRAQDWELNYRLRANGGLIWFNPDLWVTYRPRNNAKKLARQYFEYGRWRRVVIRQHQGSSNLRYLAPPINLLVNLLSLVLGTFLTSIFYLPTAIYLLALFTASLVIGKRWDERLLLPVVLIIMHFSWGFGFITSPRALINVSK